MFDKKFTEFISLLERSKSTVVLTGAGVSTFSGIPDFRSSDGIYSKQYRHLSIEEIISLPLFERDPEIFYSWAKDEWYNLADFEPSIVHILGSLEEAGKLDGLYTQNIVCFWGRQQEGVRAPRQRGPSPLHLLQSLLSV